MDAAQKLGIDSAVLREELRQAALKRRDRIEARATSLSEVERVLLRALSITDPEHEEARRTAADAVIRQPQWFEGLGVFDTLRALAERGVRDPMDVIENPAQKALLAEALLAENESPSAEGVIDAIVSLQRRKIEAELRDLRAEIQEAERRGDFAELALLTQRKLELDRALRQLRGGAGGRN
jgi:DNA primase